MPNQPNVERDKKPLAFKGRIDAINVNKSVILSAGLNKTALKRRVDETF